MKHIRYFYYVALFLLSTHAHTNEVIKNYFNKIYENEKLEFLNCINEEGLEPSNQLNTKCKISELAEEAAHILFDKEYLKPYDFLNNFKVYKKIKNNPLIYPPGARRRGIEGYVIVEYNLSKEGNPESIRIVEGWCGDTRSPYTKYKTCNDFNAVSKKAAKDLRYEPAKFKGKNIGVDGLLHRFTFLMENDELVVSNNKSKSYNIANKAIRNRDFEKAISISEKNLVHDYIFMDLIARAKFLEKKYPDAIFWSNKLKDNLVAEGREIPESMVLNSFIILTSSLFFQGRYKEITILEKDYSNYIKGNNKHNEILAITNLYFGVSYINMGNFQKGTYYLGIAAKHSNTKSKTDYIDSFVNQIESYL
ncbi:MAG: energy transducer TonB [Gammaproteobacteria bacterium]|tara:strand:- start:181 stop:1272 length:1092 start_codon:yes stop_codon:yes gene_type:complete